MGSHGNGRRKHSNRLHTHKHMNEINIYKKTFNVHSTLKFCKTRISFITVEIL